MKKGIKGLIIIWLLTIMVLSFGQLPKRLKNKAFPVEIIGMTVTPHVYIDPAYYKASDPFDSENGALIQIVVRNNSNEPVKFRLLFDGMQVADPRLIQTDGKPAYNSRQNINNPAKIPEWTWCEMPEQKAFKGRDYELGAGKTDVFTYNSYKAKWGKDYSYTISAIDPKGAALDSFSMKNSPNPVSLEFISFLSKDNNSLYPDSAVVHIKNNSKAGFKIRKMRFYGPSADLQNDPTNGFVLLQEVDQLLTFTQKGILSAGEWSGFTCSTGPLPLVRGLVEVVLQINDAETSLWAPIMFRKEQFNIGSGWLGYSSKPDSIYISPLSHESFLKTLRLMHINVVHNNNVNEYIPADLQPKYSFKHMLNEFQAVYEHPEIYNTNEFVKKAERIDCLGEPNWGRTAMESYLITKRYMLSETFPSEEWHIPTSVDHSMPQRVRYFAGIADYPSFDNYRITAPSDDRFQDYSERWGSGKFAAKTASWGAPLESVGNITRTIHAVNKPKPISAWTQNVHHNWEKGKRNRNRISPTPDEIYSQAYQILANGVTSLYWYSLEVNSILRFRDAIYITRRIGREIKMLEPFYISGAAYHYQRRNLNGNANTPDLDLNVIVTPNAALLFANDLTYIPDTAKEKASFVFKARNVKELFFPLPGYLAKPLKVVRVDADSIYDVNYKVNKDGVIILQDSIFICGVYLACHDETMVHQIEKRRQELIEIEKSLDFDPGNNDDDFFTLKKEMQSKPE